MKQVLALSYAFAVGALFFNIQPVLLGAIGVTFPVDDQQLGKAVSVGLVTAFLGLASSYFWITRVNWHGTIFAGLAVNVLAYMLLFFAAEFSQIIVALGLLGIGMALVLSPILVALGATADPTRSFGLAVSTSVLLAGLSVFLIPSWLMPGWGLQGVALFLLMATTIAVLIVRFVPSQAASKPDGGHIAQRAIPSWLPWSCLFAMALYFVGINSNWAFFERIGVQGGHSVESIGVALSIALVFGAIGSFVASYLSQKISIVTALGMALVLFLVAVLFIRVESSVIAFTLALLIFNVAWNFSLPFQMDLVARADDTGRYITLLPASQTIGGALGPLVGGTLLTSTGVDALYVLLMICSFVACLIFVLAWRKLEPLLN